MIWYPAVLLIGIPLRSCVVEQLCMYLLVICIFYFEKNIF
jgi:hypothetical protein